MRKCKNGHGSVVLWNPKLPRRSKRLVQLTCTPGKAKYRTHAMTSLKTACPSLFGLLHKTRNVDVDINSLTTKSKEPVWWSCDKAKCDHHHWLASPREVVSRKHWCPFCSPWNRQICVCNSAGGVHPHLINELDPLKNDNVDLFATSPISKQVLTWRCRAHTTCDQHVWTDSVVGRARDGRGCPFCARRGVATCRCDSFGTKVPRVVAEFDSSLNPGLDIFAVLPNSTQKFVWRCRTSSCGHHVWRATAHCRFLGTDCPFCFGVRQRCPCDSFAAEFADLADEFDHDHPENRGIDLKKVSRRSNKVVHWKCKLGSCGHHCWASPVKARTLDWASRGCPFCAGRRVCPCDSFATRYPALLAEFEPSLNPGVDPYAVACHSNVLVTWSCATARCGHHVWATSVNHRTNGTGCPFCPNPHRRVCRCDSFGTLFPDLAAEVTDVAVDIYALPPHCAEVLPWRCSTCNFRWKISVNARTGTQGTGCPRCSKSKLEQSIAAALDDLGLSYDTEAHFPDCRDVKLLYFDFRVASLRLLIEGDGQQHFRPVNFGGHLSDLEKQRRRDQIKNDYARQNSWSLVRIAISELPRVAEHIRAAIEAVRGCPSGDRYEKFIGAEYEAHLHPVDRSQELPSTDGDNPAHLSAVNVVADATSAYEDSPA